MSTAIDMASALDDEIQQILERATDTLSPAEILAQSQLADGRHTVASALHRLSARGAVEHDSTGGHRRYWLASRGHVTAPKTVRGRIQAYLSRAGVPRSMREIAGALQIERRTASRALNALATQGVLESVPLTQRGRVAWRLAAAPAETAGTAVNDPLFALASDGTLTLCTHETELALDATETAALLDYLAPFVTNRESQRSPA
ncbi:hypothetical protein QO259_10260 [Salinicola sp. JS01]|uniref:LexA family protein n=1 Tax=Salinicola sp. JS01 TaxID=3050071 RepID=UPI00255B5FA3|nr:hypothetical protein [Salinicola sp. JS01]WIX31218.1 hypothetical protein QO259_10260 [Salinicola sp. JS01]